VSLWRMMGLYVGGVIGAGFASGQELAVFFVSYGRTGLWGILAAFLVLTLGSGLVLGCCIRTNASSYQQIFAALDPRLSRICDLIYTSFLLVGLSVMLAGIGAMGTTAFRGLLFRLATSILILAVLQRGVEGAAKAGGWLAPLMVLIISAFAFYSLGRHGLAPLKSGSWRAVEAGILFGSYNLGFSLAILASVQRYVRTKRERWKLALGGNLVLGLCMVLLFLALSALDAEQLNTSFPLRGIVAELGFAGAAAYELLLWAAMFSTATAHALALANRLAEDVGLSWMQGASLVLLVSLGLSYAGFAALVRIAYPILGLAGLWILAALVRERIV
jgi:uncharacterized membrane protein YkvI